MQLELRHLQKIEAGEINVTLATFMRIAEGLREPLPVLFNKVAEPRGSYSSAGATKSEDARRAEPQRHNSGNPKWGRGTFPGSPREADLVIRDVGARLAEFRGMRNLTQLVLAESAGVALKYIQRVEAGGQNLTLRSLVRLAQALGVDAIELLTKPWSPPNHETKRKRRARTPAKKRP
jgi:transcriptional regulator with XRE-family HTH domain